MPTAISHAIPAIALGVLFSQPDVPRQAWVLGAALAVAPDLDIVGFSLGISYSDLWGHRGLSHSLPLAAVLSTLATFLFHPRSPGSRWRFLWLYFFLCSASHGFLDGFTNGGSGVAFGAPFEETRFFFPFRPILVSPISIGGIFSEWGLEVLESEILWVWMPFLLIGIIGYLGRKKGQGAPPPKSVGGLGKFVVDSRIISGDNG
jgi:inner membrane protein